MKSNGQHFPYHSSPCQEKLCLLNCSPVTAQVRGKRWQGWIATEHLGFAPESTQLASLQGIQESDYQINWIGRTAFQKLIIVPTPKLFWCWTTLVLAGLAPQSLVLKTENLDVHPTHRITWSPIHQEVLFLERTSRTHTRAPVYTLCFSLTEKEEKTFFGWARHIFSPRIGLPTDQLLLYWRLNMQIISRWCVLQHGDKYYLPISAHNAAVKITAVETGWKAGIPTWVHMCYNGQKVGFGLQKIEFKSPCN